MYFNLRQIIEFVKTRTDNPREESFTDDPFEEPITEDSKKTLSLRTIRGPYH